MKDESSTPDEVELLRRSWVANADAWTDAVRNQRIESRRLVTDAAILETIIDQQPRTVLDLGCGEGWLVRRLVDRGYAATGVDASAPLIAAARASGNGQYSVASYDDLIRRSVTLEASFDVIVANFSLLDDRATEILAAMKHYLEAQGSMIVQTTHPLMTRGDAPYLDAWRVETFQGFAGDWREPMPWYFRTIASWSKAFADGGYVISDIREPLHPETSLPASLIIVGRTAD